MAIDRLVVLALIVTGGTEPSVGRLGAQAAQAIVEIRREEAQAPHLAVGHNIDPRIFLIAQRHIDGVVQRLLHIGGAVLTALHRFDGADEPRRPGVTTDDTGG